MWLFAAILSAFFAGLTSILAKCGIRKTDSDVATALRTAVVLAGAWGMACLTGSLSTLGSISTRSMVFLLFSGLSTGASWLCYFRALAMGEVDRVVPIDKSSTVLSVLLAMLMFRETGQWPIKLGGALLLLVGILFMVEKKGSTKREQGRIWALYAVLSALFAALTSILAKFGMEGVESNLGTAIRTGVVLVMAWGILFGKRKIGQVKEVDRKELLFILLSGVATCASWLCYYYAIQNGQVSVVVPIDKMSILVTVGFSYIVFHEKLSRKALLGLALMLAGTLALALGA